MMFWQPITNLREYITNKPPGVTFFFCLLVLALSFFCLSGYSYTHTQPNPDVLKDWNSLLASIAQYDLCERNNTRFTPIVAKLPNVKQETHEESLLNSTTMGYSGSLLYVRVPLVLFSNDLSQSISLQTSFTSSQLQLEGNETCIVTIDFTANDSNSCLSISAPSHLLPLSQVPPTCLRRANEKAVYTEPRKLMAPALNCYSLQSKYDPSLEVMLTKEEQLVSVRHLVEVGVVLLGVCLILCMSVSITHSTVQRHRWIEQDHHHQEPLIDE